MPPAKLRPLFIVASLLATALCLSGCSLARRGVAAFRSTSDFMTLGSDNRVRYEPGAEEFAAEIAGYLPEAVATVEREQYRPFAKPVEVYVCRTGDSFARYTGFKARGALTVKLFLAADMIKGIKDGSSAKALLTHELSHLHFQQFRGVFGYGDIPEWFKEGMAVNVSGGAPAFDVTEEQAGDSILAGKHIEPVISGSVLFPKLWDSYGLEPHMFYKQSAMFVAYIKRTDELGFSRLMNYIDDGLNFSEAFKRAFGISVEESWGRFLAGLEA